jgi:hypothetical protein
MGSVSQTKTRLSVFGVKTRRAILAAEDSSSRARLTRGCGRYADMNVGG